MTDEGIAERDGVEANAIVVEQLTRALEIIQFNKSRSDRHPWRRVLVERRSVLRAR